MAEIDYFGHVTPGEGLEKSIMLKRGQGVWKIGTPRRRWPGEVTKSQGNLIILPPNFTN